MSPVEQVEFEFKEATNSPEFKSMGTLDRLKTMKEWKAKIAEVKNQQSSELELVKNQLENYQYNAEFQALSEIDKFNWIREKEQDLERLSMPPVEKAQTTEKTEPLENRRDDYPSPF